MQRRVSSPRCFPDEGNWGPDVRTALFSPATPLKLEQPCGYLVVSKTRRQMSVGGGPAQTFVKLEAWLLYSWLLKMGSNQEAVQVSLLSFL